MKLPDGHVLQQVLAQVGAKTLRMGAGEPDVVVHVKRRDARPVDRRVALPGGGDESGEEFILGGGAGENDAGLALGGDDIVDLRRGRAAGGGAESRAVGMDFDRETAGSEVAGGGGGHE